MLNHDRPKRKKKEKNDHNKHARKTEGTRFAQMIRRKFGKNRPKPRS